MGEEAIFPVNASTPVSVMSNVCSNWAEGLPSAVAWVHASGQATGKGLPKYTNWGDTRQETLSQFAKVMSVHCIIRLQRLRRKSQEIKKGTGNFSMAFKLRTSLTKTYHRFYSEGVSSSHDAAPLFVFVV